MLPVLFLAIVIFTYAKNSFARKYVGERRMGGGNWMRERYVGALISFNTEDVLRHYLQIMRLGHF